jgi:hypothetical protein
MAIAVNDVRSNPHEQIYHAVTVLKRSPRLQRVFVAISAGGKKPKTVTQLMKITGYNQVVVLQLGGKLADEQLVQKTKVDGETAYEKDRYLAAKRTKIISMAENPAKLKALPTKYSPKSSPGKTPIRVSITGAKIQISEATCDDFDQFGKVKKIRAAPRRTLSEKAFKDGIRKLIGENGEFKDWGGERNDLYTTKLRHKGKRRAIAFAFKGPGTTGVLTPRKLGKNGDQIQRLFLSPAEIFIVQYHSQIDQSVIEQMRAFATLNSVREGKRVGAVAFGVEIGLRRPPAG